MMQGIFRFVSALISVYMVIILIRILLTWFRGAHTNRAEEFLSSVTDPYLNWFRHNLPVRFGALDFSPVVAILILGLLNTVANQLAFAGTITFGFILAIIVSAVWSVISFFITLFLIAGIIRFIGIVANLDNGGRFWLVLEQLVNPAIQTVVRPLLRGRFTNYRDSLLIFNGILLALLIAGRLLVSFLVRLIENIPF